MAVLGRKGRTRKIASGVVLLACALVALLAPASASAGSINTSTDPFGNHFVVYTANPGETNNLLFLHAGGVVGLIDLGNNPTDGDGAGPCTVAGNSASCPDTSVAYWNVYLNDGNDTLNAPAHDIPTRTWDGPGNDTIIGTPGNDTLNNEAGNDSFTGNGGTDVIAYISRPAGVRVSTDGVADDGEPGEADNAAADVELILGTTHSDTLIGNSNDNLIVGCGGDDTMMGGPGDDVLTAPLILGCPTTTGDDTFLPGSGKDTVVGDNGSDTVSYADQTNPVSVSLDGVANDGGPGENDSLSGIENMTGGSGSDILTGDSAANVLSGGAGNDTLDGGQGTDVVAGETGNDILRIRDGFIDSASCGTGRDSVDADAADTLLDTCDDIFRDGKKVAKGTCPTAMVAATIKLKKKAKTIPATVAYPSSGTGTCSGTITLNSSVKSGKRKKAKRLKLGSAKFSVAADQKSTVNVTLGSKALKALSKAKKLKATVVVTAKDETGATKTATSRSTLKAAAKAKKKSRR